MTKKIPFGVALALMLATAAVTVTLTVTIYTKQTDALIGDMPQRAGQYALLEEVDAIVRAGYYGEIDPSAQQNDLAEGYLAGLGDPYTRYLSPEAYAQYVRANKGAYSGVGLTAAFDRVLNALTVRDVSPYSSARSAGVKAGDVVLTVNGKEVTLENAESVIGELQTGEKGTVRITASHPGENGGQYEATLEKGYTVPACEVGTKEGFGYIRVIRFSEDTPALFQEALDRFAEENAAGVIVDVRSNDGGEVSSAARAADCIVPLASAGTGAVATEENSSGEAIAVYPADSRSCSVPIAVLINSRTGGAAELFAADLHEFGKAFLIGEPTAGHGTSQRIFPLKNGGAVQLTVAKIVTYLGNGFERTGVLPDEVVPMSAADKDLLFSETAAADGQLSAAVAFLKG